MLTISPLPRPLDVKYALDKRRYRPNLPLNIATERQSLHSNIFANDTCGNDPRKTKTPKI